MTSVPWPPRYCGVATENAELIIEQPDGTRLTTLVNIQPLFDAAGRIQGAINCFHRYFYAQRHGARARQPQRPVGGFPSRTAWSPCISSMIAASWCGPTRPSLMLLGYRTDDYIGRPITDFHADGPVIADILTRLGRGEPLADYPARLRARDGSIRHARISSSSRFSEGRFVGSRCCTIDVTRQNEMEEKVRTGERQLRELLEAIPAAIYTTDAQGRITFYNEAAAQLAGAAISRWAWTSGACRGSFTIWTAAPCRRTTKMPDGRLPERRAAGTGRASHHRTTGWYASPSRLIPPHYGTATAKSSGRSTCWSTSRRTRKPTNGRRP